MDLEADRRRIQSPVERYDEQFSGKVGSEQVERRGARSKKLMDGLISLLSSVPTTKACN